jgi:hypothetical protein
MLPVDILYKGLEDSFYPALATQGTFGVAFFDFKRLKFF